MSDDDKYMNIALEEAKKAYSMNEIPVGAVVVLKNKIIAKAHNLKDSTGIVTKHAEIIAIEKANKKLKDWRLNGAIMYITLEPCPMCASAIQQSRIAKIVYGAASSNLYNTKIVKNILKNKDSNHIVLLEKYKKSDGSKKLISDFFKKIR